MLRAGEETAGFVLVRADIEEGDYEIGEFFVLRKFRGQGVGERIARQLFDRFRGRWEVMQLVRNAPAVAFWRRVIDRYSGGNFKEQQGRNQWGQTNVIRFATGGCSQPVADESK